MTGLVGGRRVSISFNRELVKKFEVVDGVELPQIPPIAANAAINAADNKTLQGRDEFSSVSADSGAPVALAYAKTATNKRGFVWNVLGCWDGCANYRNHLMKVPPGVVPEMRVLNGIRCGLPPRRGHNASTPFGCYCYC